MKRFLKSFCSFGLVLLLILSLSITSFADVNKLMIGTGSNALMTMELDDSDYSVMPMSSIASITNTISYSGAYLCLYENNGSGSYWNNIKLDSAGYASYIVPDGHTVSRYGLLLHRESIPSPNVYKMVFDYSSEVSVDYTSLFLTSTRYNSNAVNSGSSNGLSFTENSGDIYSETIVEIGSINDMRLFMSFSEPLGSGSLVGGQFKVNFTLSDDEPDKITAGVGMSDTSYQDGVSSSLSDLSSSVDSMTEDLSSAAQNLEYISTSQNLIIQGIDNVIMHISDQLYAFWDQLYNLIHEPTYAKLEEILGALRAIANNADIYQVVEEIRASNNKVIANDNKLSADQTAADKANTEQIDNAIEEHGNFIIDGLKGLFIPSDEFFKAYFDDLYAYFSDRFGFLSFPIDLLVRTVNLFINSSDVDAVLTLPSFEISGEQVWADQSFNFTEFLETNFAFLLAAIRTVTSIGMIYAFVNLCQDKWDEVMKS